MIPFITFWKGQIRTTVIKTAITNTQKHLYQSAIATIMLKNNSKIQCLQE